MKLDVIRCDGLGCTATCGRSNTEHDGWMSLTVNEYARDRVFSRHADLCPVHASAFLDVCGPLPRSA